MQLLKAHIKAGFTLVELVVVITLIGIVATIGAQLILKPVEGFVDVSRRAELVDAADNALRRMQRDIRQALPNSLRLRGTTQLELLHTIEGGRYRAQGPGNILDFTRPDNRFDVLGALRSNPVNGHWLVVYNIAPSGTLGNAYDGGNRSLINGGNLNRINIQNHQFPLASPRQRFFIVDEPVTYICDTVAGTLTRHSGYNTNANTPPANPVGGVAALMANNIQSCQFSYVPGTSQRAGLVTLMLVLEDEGEQIRLLHQVHVENTP